MDEKLLTNEEKIIFSLRDLYRKYGYLHYRMSKFEEYELYIRHKEFMVSDRVIAFNDTDGKMLALKPDVTLSVIKSGTDEKGVKQKVYYNENVYRVSSGTRCFKEIMQAGLECIGDTDLYDTYEVISLAAQSLATISENYVLSVSHLGILSSVLADLCSQEEFGKEAACYIAQKNKHDLRTLCRSYAVAEEGYDLLCRLIESDGKGIFSLLNGMPYADEVRSVFDLLSALPDADRIRFDFSLVGDINYYNGFIFKGYIDGVETAVLSGGQYDKMMEKMGRKSRAVGFAIYLDLFSRFYPPQKEYDVDFLLLYDKTVPERKVSEKTADLIAKGFSCSAQKAVPEKLKYKEIIDLRR